MPEPLPLDLRDVRGVDLFEGSLVVLSMFLPLVRGLGALTVTSKATGQETHWVIVDLPWGHMPLAFTDTVEGAREVTLRVAALYEDAGLVTSVQIDPELEDRFQRIIEEEEGRG